MKIPTIVLEKRKISRVILSIRTGTSFSSRTAFSLMREAYGIGFSHFDLPTSKHLDPFRELKILTEDESLEGFCHLDVVEGISLHGKPFRSFESRILSTLKKNLPPHAIRSELLPSASGEVLTQKEIDRIAFNLAGWEKALAPFRPDESPFLVVGEKYGDWILALGRIDLLHRAVETVRQRGFIPIYSGQWTTFTLPSAKPLDAAAFAVPINSRGSLFDFSHACNLAKKFEKPVVSLDPLAGGSLLTESSKAFSFLFNDLKIHAAIAEAASEKEVKAIADGIIDIPSVTPPRRT